MIMSQYNNNNNNNYHGEWQSVRACFGCGSMVLFEMAEKTMTGRPAAQFITASAANVRKNENVSSHSYAP
jgi:hypothetical protein